jgi:hypothetical protein
MKSIIAVVLSAAAAIQVHSQVALTPSGPVITPSAPALLPDAPALAPVPANSNTIITNATLVSLSGLLQVLQTNLQQTLPVLSLFNDNFDFVSLGDNGLAAAAASTPAGNFSQNLATNYAANFAVNTAVSTGGSLFNTAAARVNPAAAGLPSGTANVPVTRETLRALLVLQSDIQRMLPVLNALNSGTATFPGSFTNLFGIVPNSP